MLLDDGWRIISGSMKNFWSGLDVVGNEAAVASLLKCLPSHGAFESVHRLHGRKSEHLVFADLHDEHAALALVRFAIRRAFWISSEDTVESI